MKKVLFVIFLLGTAIWSSAQTVKEYFVTDNPIAFDNTHFYLGWSSNPSKGYFLHEYFPKGETPEQFNKMFTVSIVETGITAKDAAMAKANELTKRKENDNICNSTFGSSFNENKNNKNPFCGIDAHSEHL